VSVLSTLLVPSPQSSLSRKKLKFKVAWRLACALEVFLWGFLYKIDVFSPLKLPSEALGWKKEPCPVLWPEVNKGFSITARDK
jgi:hypothetical protein